MNRLLRPAFPALVLIFLLFPLGVTAAAEGEGEIGAFVGGVVPDSDLLGFSEGFDDMEPLVGIRGGYQFDERLGWFADLWLSQIPTTDFGDADTFTGRLGLELFLGENAETKPWLVTVGLGLMDLDADAGVDDRRSILSAGFGRKYRLGDRMDIRWELRADRTFDSDASIGSDDLMNGMFLVGLSWGVGGEPVDSDGDGVVDRKDRCPDTPRGAVVDEQGCPKDSDGDGVYDGLDKCPDTPKGWPVDRDGCPKDSDGDGVPDGKDDCPDTPRGAVVDGQGCPKDSDGDGVYDGLDKCPDTPKGWPVDRDGCPKDSDGDGVPDGRDRCPDTARGVEVDEDGCEIKKAAPLFEEKRTLVLEGVYFETDSAVLKSESTTVLDRVATSLADWPEVRVEIGGHTDSRGRDAYNQDLSLRRAASVRDYLVGRGIDASRLTARGYGESRPVADNGSAEGRAQNRRVELTRLD